LLAHKLLKSLRPTAKIDGSIGDSVTLAERLEYILPDFEVERTAWGLKKTRTPRSNSNGREKWARNNVEWVASLQVLVTSVLFQHPPVEVADIAFVHDVPFGLLELFSSVHTKELPKLRVIARLYTTTLVDPQLMSLDPCSKALACVVLSANLDQGGGFRCGVLSQGLQHVSGFTGNEDALHIAISAIRKTLRAPARRIASVAAGSRDTRVQRPPPANKQVDKGAFQSPSPDGFTSVPPPPRKFSIFSMF